MQQYSELGREANNILELSQVTEVFAAELLLVLAVMQCLAPVDTMEEAGVQTALNGP